MDEGYTLDDRYPRRDPETGKIMHDPETGETIYLTAEESLKIYDL
jgi:hypothetical protein